MSLQRYFLQLSYQGTNYCGWQWQRNAPNSVQGSLQSALAQVLHQPVTVVGCGRTDAGVHASAYYAHFDLATPLPGRFRTILNHALPPDIAVQSVQPVSADLHARYSATQRTYRYYFHTHKQPIWHQTSTYLPFLEKPLDFEAMQAAATHLLHYDDFRAFCKVPDRHTHTRCTVVRAKLSHEEEPFVFEITADRFVRGMVRLIVAQLLEVGKGKITAIDFEQMLRTRQRPPHLVFAPPQGLYLTQVVYPTLSKLYGDSDKNPGPNFLR
ncbi:MAG: tRNA pseudouridine(38-40) synthase TruA [Bacteroidetes bacterium]|nr:MAG: tRNA pseudouridine(38-40) synthase TruA [Bacteroidota bacterium]